jgi:glycosyltransferase involved in cell wall biosynthesis
MNKDMLNFGFVSTRFAGTDGVSLETEKWVEALKGLGHSCFCFSGESDWPEDRQSTVPEAHFKHPDIRSVNKTLFNDHGRSTALADKIEKIKKHLKQTLSNFRDDFDIDIIIVENAWSLPMNVPLGLALTEWIAETRLPAIGHHHDFWWERRRYLGAPADDYLNAAFPSTLPWIEHVVINSIARRQLSFRKGVSTLMIPNVMNFDSPPPEPDDYQADLRQELDIGKDTAFFLQPTRVVPRKNIQQAIELIRKLEKDAVLVVTHDAGDTGEGYQDYLTDFADTFEVRILFAAQRFNQKRGTAPDGNTIYSLADAYQQCDMVTYPSVIEGFGNTFLETVYYRRPLIMSAYEIFKMDIQPKGFNVLVFDEFTTHQTSEQVDRLLQNLEQISEMTNRNYELGCKYYSYDVLRKHLRLLIHNSVLVAGRY